MRPVPPPRPELIPDQDGLSARPEEAAQAGLRGPEYRPTRRAVSGRHSVDRLFEGRHQLETGSGLTRPDIDFQLPPNSQIYSIWLSLPDVDGPFLEIQEYKDTQDRPQPRVNEPGFEHLSFEVKNIKTTLADVLEAGGKPLGEVTDFGAVNRPYLIVYVRDPEGNILELEQP